MGAQTDQIYAIADGLKQKEKKGPGEESAKQDGFDLDEVLVNELGQFGWYQVRSLLLISLLIVMDALKNEYVFSAAAVSHRCRVSECGERSPDTEFAPFWLSNAIPLKNGAFASCERFSPLGGNGSLDSCPSDLFNQSRRVPCDGLVYARDNLVSYDFNLGCREWTRTLAGTLNSAGFFVALPLSGYVSDRYGRKVALLASVFNLALFGLLRAFSLNYTMYVALQFVQTALGAGTYISAYMLATELVGPKYRVVTSATCSSIFSVGLVVLASAAWLIQPWRYLVAAIHLPCFIIVSYYWLLSESVRWLVSKGRYDEAKIVLEKVAKVNKKQLSPKTIKSLMNNPTQSKKLKNGDTTNNGVFKQIFKSPVLLRRVCTTPVWWITATFVYYGLNINSTSLSEDMYLNYMCTVAIDIPGYYLAVLVLDRVGRKPTLSCGYFLSATCNLAFAFMPKSLGVMRLLCYFVGKFGICVVFTSLYLYTSELYPTEYRHSLLGFSSMVGRVGLVLAPMTPALAQYWEGSATFLFGLMGLLSGALVLTQPETLGAKMPDTMAQAEALGATDTTSLRQR